MMNLADAAVGALTDGSAWAPVVAAVCGVATAVGPCGAPRAVALSALTARGERRRRLLCVVAFVLGLCVCYATAGYVAASGGRSPAASPLTYELTALGLCVAGAYALLADRCVTKASSSAGFAFGALCASAASPCCTALLAPIAIAAAAAGEPLRAALLMACFSVGHVVPSALAAALARVGTSNAIATYLPALRTVGAAVTLATGLYYAVLA